MIFGIREFDMSASILDLGYKYGANEEKGESSQGKPGNQEMKYITAAQQRAITEGTRAAES